MRIVMAAEIMLRIAASGIPDEPPDYDHTSREASGGRPAAAGSLKCIQDGCIRTQYRHELCRVDYYERRPKR